MTTDLLVLVALGALAFLLQNVGAFSHIAAQPAAGLKWGVGNRDEGPTLAPWAARAGRAHRNLLENLPHYTIIVLVLAVAGRADAFTATASLVYLGARAAHAAVYAAGIPYVRTLAYYTGVAAEIALLTRVF
jgi:uncharacterized MAPEG superfamily protein